ncbi:hypothetical protein D3C76_1873830 [compost metagenome]
MLKGAVELLAHLCQNVIIRCAPRRIEINLDACFAVEGHIQLVTDWPFHAEQRYVLAVR